MALPIQAVEDAEAERPEAEAWGLCLAPCWLSTISRTPTSVGLQSPGRVDQYAPPAAVAIGAVTAVASVSRSPDHSHSRSTDAGNTDRRLTVRAPDPARSPRRPIPNLCRASAPTLQSAPGSPQSKRLLRQRRRTCANVLSGKAWNPPGNSVATVGFPISPATSDKNRLRRPGQPKSAGVLPAVGVKDNGTLGR